MIVSNCSILLVAMIPMPLFGMSCHLVRNLRRAALPVCVLIRKFAIPSKMSSGLPRGCCVLYGLHQTGSRVRRCNDANARILIEV